MAIIWDQQPESISTLIDEDEEITIDDWLKEVEEEVDAAIELLEKEESPWPEKGKGFGK